MLQKLMAACGARRERFFEQMPDNSAAILCAAPEVLRMEDSHYPYRQDNDFFYLTGFSEPEAFAVLTKKDAVCEFFLFCRPKDPIQAAWVGDYVGLEDAVAVYGADGSFDQACFFEQLPELCADDMTIYLLHDRMLDFVHDVADVLGITHAHDQLPGSDLAKIIHPLRRCKTPYEIHRIQEAIRISTFAHRQAMRACPHVENECQIQAIFEGACLSQGAVQAYPPIVAAGNNANVLHYMANKDRLGNGMMLIDAGCEYQGYCSDITRTYPVSGKFNLEQKALYEHVLAVNQAVINIAQPGVSWSVLNETAVRGLTMALIDLGVLAGSIDSLIEQQAYKPYYMHGVSHFLGLAVHDCGPYKENDEWINLQPGMVLTVEPGLYFREDDETVPLPFRGMGVRIEDDVLITDKHSLVLTSMVPKHVDDIEACMAEAYLPLASAEKER